MTRVWLCAQHEQEYRSSRLPLVEWLSALPTPQRARSRWRARWLSTEWQPRTPQPITPPPERPAVLQPGAANPRMRRPSAEEMDTLREAIPVPGLGNAVTTHGLPADVNPEAFEAALSTMDGLSSADTLASFSEPAPAHRQVRVAAPQERSVILPHSQRRAVARVQNLGPSAVLLDLGASQQALQPGETWNSPYQWRAQVQALWLGPGGSLRVTEIELNGANSVALFIAGN